MRTINFNNNFGEYQNGTPYIITENDLLAINFNFDNNECKPKRLKAVYSIGEKRSKILDVSNDRILQIPYSFFVEALNSPGTAELWFELHEFTESGFEINKGRYKVEPLAITKIDENVEVYPVVQDLKNQIIQLIKENKSIKEKLKANMLATLRYLYRHYTKDLTDSDKDLSLNDFAKAIGYDVSDLTEQELKEVEEFSVKEGIL